MMRKIFSTLGRVAVTLVVVAGAFVVGRSLWDYYINEPWTRDAHVRADVVGVAPDVSGLVSEVLVHDNDTIHRGDVLFRIDRDRFVIALQQADAVAAGRKSSLEQAQRDLVRRQELHDFASRQSVEQAQTAMLQATSAYQQAIADQGLARLNLARSEVKAAVNGVITNLELRQGDYVSSGKAVMALVDTDSLRVEGYFEETKLARIHVGNAVTIRLMGQPVLLHGRVQSVAAAITDPERTVGSSLLANIDPTFTWVRLAQRVPVRIRLEDVPADIRLVAGLTATVEIQQPQGASEAMVPVAGQARYQ